MTSRIRRSLVPPRVAVLGFGDSWSPAKERTWHPNMPMNVYGWVGTASGAYSSCTGSPLYPVSGSHFSGATVWLSDDINWYVSCSGAPDSDELDLCSGALHEFGHLMGISHTCQISATVMCPSLNFGQRRRTLTHDDIRHTEEMYSCHPPPVGGCK